ncbi:hypothetical protein [Terricaulis sp.]|uniref:hypothetical protein n=1 Tax=Terricaulis sp. TaxID=2768686 RepID=UPI0037845B1B
MVNPEPPPNTPRAKARLPFEEKPFRSGQKNARLFLYGVLTLGLAGLAAYMALVMRMPLTSGYVAAPAVGALWFGLRTFMSLNVRG